MHLKRWLTGILAVPLLIAVIGFGPRWLFCVLLSAASLAALFEFYGIVSRDLPRFLRWSGAFLLLLLFLVIYERRIFLILPLLALWAFVPMVFFMLLHPSPEDRGLEEIGLAVLGPVYVGLPIAMLMMTDLIPRGTVWIFFLLTVVFSGDTGAFYFGRLLGRHKLYEAVSPGKTWEGAFGGMGAGLFAGFLFLKLSGLHPLNLKVLLLITAISIAGQVGDLAESMLKRKGGVKDSGNMLPGHGGILDRIDGLLFSIPVLYAYLSFFAV